MVLYATIFVSLFFTAASAASAAELPKKMEVAGNAPQPAQHAEFCKQTKTKWVCEPSGSSEVINLQDKFEGARQIQINTNRAFIHSINADVNNNKEWCPSRQIDIHWELPRSGKDCISNYAALALLKQRGLTAAGYPLSALLLTKVTIKKGQVDEEHWVIIARTNLGDFVLDGRNDDFLLWSVPMYHSYRFGPRQSENDPTKWVDIKETRGQFLEQR